METLVETFLPATPSAVGQARHVVDPLARRYPRHFIATLQLAISELVTNSVRHGGGEVVALRVGLKDSLLRIEVYDEGPGFAAEARDPSPQSTHGRGLLIVEALAFAWGSEATGERNCVWAEFLPEDSSLSGKTDEDRLSPASAADGGGHRRPM